LAAGSNCTINVTFTPTATGTRGAALTVTDNASNSPQMAGLSGTGIGASGGPLPQFGHVAVVAETHYGYSSVVGNPSMPYLNSLIARYGLATNFVADTSPSIDNFFMLTVGKFEAGNDGSWNCNATTGVVSDDHIVRELNNAGKTWKVYAESIPSTGYTGCHSGDLLYLKYHNPFAYLTDVANVPAQAAKMVDFTNNFASDLANSTLPQYSFIVPNVDNDARDGTLAQADSWLQTNIDPLIQSALFKKDGLLVILFDYDQSATSGCSMTQIQAGTYCGGRVAAVVVSPFLVSAGYQSTNSYHHENVLKLTAQALGLTTFPGISSTATNMSDFFSAQLPAVTLSPTALTFASQTVGTTSAAQAVTLTNSQSTALSITSIAFTGTNSGDFGQTNNCPLSPSTLAANGTCTINVTFAPTATGTRSATLAVTDNASNSPQTASLSGTGTTLTASAPTFVQVQNNIVTTTTAQTSLSVNITTGAGNLLVAFCRESSSGTDNFTVTDSAGQTWTQTSSGYKNESDTGPRVSMFYVANSAAVTSVTVHYTTSGGVNKPGIMVFEISGAASSGVADGSANNGTASNTTTSTSGSLTPTNANDILIFATDASGNESGWTAGAGYVIPNNSVTTGGSGSNLRMAMQYTVVTSAQTNTTTGMTYTNSNWNGNIFAAFK
jgi:acid phosphatase